jgi:hypothetical protein
VDGSGGGGGGGEDAGGWDGEDAAVQVRCPLLWLRLRGINYRAQVWLNGKLVPEDGGATAVEGMFRRWNYLLSSTSTSNSTNTSRTDSGYNVGQNHVLAVLVEPPPYPGTADGGQGGSHDLAKSTTMQFSGGCEYAAVRTLHESVNLALQKKFNISISISLFDIGVAFLYPRSFGAATTRITGLTYHLPFYAATTRITGIT